MTSLRVLSMPTQIANTPHCVKTLIYENLSHEGLEFVRKVHCTYSNYVQRQCTNNVRNRNVAKHL